MFPYNTPSYQGRLLLSVASLQCLLLGNVCIIYRTLFDLVWVARMFCGLGAFDSVVRGSFFGLMCCLAHHLGHVIAYQSLRSPSVARTHSPIYLSPFHLQQEDIESFAHLLCACLCVCVSFSGRLGNPGWKTTSTSCLASRETSVT